MERVIELDVSVNKEKPNLYKNKEEMDCPFCNIEKIKKEGLYLGKEPTESIYWTKNKFPTLVGAYQTLILETDKCNENFRTYSLQYTQKLIDYVIEKRKELEESGRFDKVLVFKNSGLLSGGTIPHSHTQIVGVENYTDVINTRAFIEGMTIQSTSSTQLTLSTEPLAESYEFNISWGIKEGMPLDAAYYLRELIKYMDIFQDGKYKDYNLVIEDIDGRRYIKILYRRAINLLVLAYKIHPVPNNLEDIANELAEYLKPQE